MKPITQIRLIYLKLFKFPFYWAFICIYYVIEEKSLKWWKFHRKIVVRCYNFSNFTFRYWLYFVGAAYLLLLKKKTIKIKRNQIVFALNSNKEGKLKRGDFAIKNGRIILFYLNLRIFWSSISIIVFMNLFHWLKWALLEISEI